MDGFVLVDKPAGLTSHDVVAKVRIILQQAESSKLKARSQTKKLLAKDFQLSAVSPKVKVGHTGTLDPMATGLLILVLGNYTRKAGEFSALDKTYDAEVMLGLESSTGDAEGEIRRRSNLEPTNEEVGLALGTFIGTIDQKPPPYSAIKVGGRRAYKLAREGQIPDIRPRKVTIYDITDVTYHYPTIKFTASVSSGTYIRSLAEDIGRELVTGAYLSALRRTKVGDYELKDSLALDKIDYESLAQHLKILE